MGQKAFQSRSVENISNDLKTHSNLSTKFEPVLKKDRVKQTQSIWWKLQIHTTEWGVDIRGVEGMSRFTYHGRDYRLPVTELRHQALAVDTRGQDGEHEKIDVHLDAFDSKRRY